MPFVYISSCLCTFCSCLFTFCSIDLSIFDDFSIIKLSENPISHRIIDLIYKCLDNINRKNREFTVLFLIKKSIECVCILCTAK